MMTKKTLLMVVVYPAITKYLNDYFLSVARQTNTNFDFLVLNDQLKHEYIKAVHDNSFELKMPDNLTPAQIRQLGIQYTLEKGYQNLIFSDADDYFSNNRIELSEKGLMNYHFVFNNIEAVNNQGNPILMNYKLYDECSEYNNYKNIIDYNVFGMSNTGIKADFLHRLCIPANVIAIDWYIFTILLLHGAKGGFIHQATTYYRQTDDNLVGMKKPLDEERLSFGIMVKTVHYENVLKYCKEHKLEFAVKDYLRKYNEMKDLRIAVTDNKFLKNYLDTINTRLDIIYKGWWSEILPLNKWRKYANRFFQRNL